MLLSHVTYDKNAALTSQQLLASNPRRKSITIYPSRTADVTVSNDAGVTADNGIHLAPGQAALYFDVDFHGECVQQEWYAIYVGSTVPVGLIVANY